MKSTVQHVIYPPYLLIKGHWTRVNASVRKLYRCPIRAGSVKLSHPAHLKCGDIRRHISILNVWRAVHSWANPMYHAINQQYKLVISWNMILKYSSCRIKPMMIPRFYICSNTSCFTYSEVRIKIFSAFCIDRGNFVEQRFSCLSHTNSVSWWVIIFLHIYSTFGWTTICASSPFSLTHFSMRLCFVFLLFAMSLSA